MTTKDGFKQLNFQLPEKAFLALENECFQKNMTKSEFCSRVIVAYFLAKELGIGIETFGL
jgi:hypothetical protein